MTKTRILIALGVLSVAFLAGRASVQTTETKVASVEQSKDNTQDTVKTHTVITVTKQTNGAESSTTTTDVTEQKKSTDIDVKHVDSDTIVAAKSQGINASVLYAPSLFDRTKPAVYGVSVTKQVLGPITVGVFGLTNQTVGLSLGVTF